jgi:hypothetical protein
MEPIGGSETLSKRGLRKAMAGAEKELGVLLPLVEGEWRREEDSLRSV